MGVGLGGVLVDPRRRLALVVLPHRVVLPHGVDEEAAIGVAPQPRREDVAVVLRRLALEVEG